MKILIEMKHGLGDNIFILPMLEELRKEYYDAKFYIIVNGNINIELLELGKVIIEKFYVVNKRQSIGKNIKNLYDIYVNDFDIAILSVNVSDFKGKLFFKLVHAKKYIGEQYQKIDRRKLFQRKHFVDRNLEIIQSIVKKYISYTEPKIYLDDHYVKKLKSLYLKINDIKYVGICVGKGLPSKYKQKKFYPKEWGDDYIYSLINLLLINGFAVCLFGGQEETYMEEKLKKILHHKRVFNFINRTSITESAAIAKCCDLVVGVDTGMQHIAAAIGTPTLSIFGPTNPNACGAYSKKAYFMELKKSCRYCYETEQSYTCRKRECMREIIPEMVYKKIILILNNICHEGKI